MAEKSRYYYISSKLFESFWKKKEREKNMGPLVIHSSQGEGGELVLERSIGYLDGWEIIPIKSG